MKGDITGNEQTFGNRVITLVSLLGMRVAKKDTTKGSRVKFVGMMEVDIRRAAKHFKW